MNEEKRTLIFMAQGKIQEKVRTAALLLFIVAFSVAGRTGEVSGGGIEGRGIHQYETTDRDKDIHVKMHHIILGTSRPPFVIREAMVVENRGEKIYAGSGEVEPGRKETFRISLPEGATDVQYSQTSIVHKGDSLIYTGDIRPGTTNIVFSYRINPGKSNYTLKKSLPFGTDGLQFIFPDAGLRAKSPQLVHRNRTTTMGRAFLFLSGKDLPGGSQVLVNISLPGRPLARNIFMGGIIGLAILLTGAGMVISCRKESVNWSVGGSGSEHGGPEEASPIPERRRLLETIADLDEQAESGVLDAQTYQKKRSEVLNRAKEISKQIKNNAVKLG